ATLHLEKEDASCSSLRLDAPRHKEVIHTSKPFGSVLFRDAGVGVQPCCPTTMRSPWTRYAIGFGTEYKDVPSLNLKEKRYVSVRILAGGRAADRPRPCSGPGRAPGVRPT